MAVSLNASRRTEHGKGVARKLRGSGRVPAVVYGHGDQTEALSLDAHELERLLSTISVDNTLINLDVEGGRRDVLIREVQMHPFKPEVLHVDFIQVHAGEPIELQVPVRVVGTPRGVLDEGGVLDQIIYDLEIKCLPRHIPEVAEVDVSGLGIGESARVRDVQIPNVTILNDEEQAIATVLAPTVHAVEEPAAAEAAPEPEVIRERRGDEEA
ncbi:MAG TPA: 50S ribosomal protein L25 [Longimicrobiaceae bacterium]|nr:50S ribosomal protein L25 [Longimicrobiaceae bacterium]